MISFRVRSMSQGAKWPGVPCEERKRHEEVYNAAVAAIVAAGRNVPDMKSEAWRNATKETREACQAALDDLNRHRNEHGC